MADWTELVSDAMGQVNAVWDDIKGRILSQLGIQDPLQIMSYRGYGTPEQLYLKGRVLEDEGIKLREEDAPVWKNLWNMYRRFETDEIPGARVRVCLGDVQQEVVANDEGYFEAEIRVPSPLERDRLWQTVQLELLEPQSRSKSVVRTEEQVLIVSDRAKFGVISDIDDTVMHTAATDLLKMIAIAYLGNERTRRPFDGVPAFYQALRAGQSGNDGNPIFYVSSSAWNMYDLFAKFMDFNEVPHGPILLRDIELSPENLLSFEHQTHKLELIRPILERFPDLPFLLIGDSGQKDAEIYHQLVKEYPERIAGVYIRTVAGDGGDRPQTLNAIAEDVRQRGTEFITFGETFEAAEHAAHQGWIKAPALQRV